MAKEVAYKCSFSHNMLMTLVKVVSDGRKLQVCEHFRVNRRESGSEVAEMLIGISLRIM
jgi:hypothetical protein